MSTSIEQFASAVAPKAERVGQGTMVEQARAATEVQGAIYIARQFPRDMDAAKTRMIAACAQPELAERAFYSYPRGKETITGMTIDVATELARCWGNVEYGLTEMRRDDRFGQSETLAWAWDLETNVRISNTFIIPHVRDTKKGSYRVTESRDIYEVVANMGNRRMRAAIFKVLPRWFQLQAETALKATLRQGIAGDEKPFAEQLADEVDQFLSRYGITRAQLEQKAGRKVEKFTPDDLVQLRTLRASLNRGDLRVEQAFPSAQVTADEIKGAAQQSDGSPFDHEGEHDDSGYRASCPACAELMAEADREAAES